MAQTCPGILQARTRSSGVAALVVSLILLAPACVGTSLQVPSGHPARSDAASPPSPDAGAILRSDARVYTPEDTGGEEAPVHDHHGAPAEEDPEEMPSGGSSPDHGGH